MRLRKLEQKDAPFMLEWMHDPTVVENLKANFAEKTIEDCKAFIRDADGSTIDLHLAITGDSDEYMGTVSLKHITETDAEFGITIRKTAMGKGLSAFAIRKILDIGFEDFSLKRIYWCVDPENHRAVRFYDKNGYTRSSVPDNVTGYTEDEKKRFIWYCEER